MCGIVCAFDLKQDAESLRPQLLEMSKRIRHRGPDWSGIYSSKNAILAHERLAIVDPTSGKQPILSEDSLKEMMQDPRYWSKNDPAFVRQVEAGFKKLALTTLRYL